MNRVLTKEYLYFTFRSYVPAEQLKEYDEDYRENCKNSRNSILAFFPKYVDFDYYHKHPKNPADAYWFDHFLNHIKYYGLGEAHTGRKQRTQSHRDSNHLLREKVVQLKMKFER